MKAPNFSLEDQNNKIHNLKDYLGKWIVLYFYPKDDTPGCTKEACGFRDASHDYKKKGIVVLGISKDSVTSHKKFTEKYRLNFSILSDESKEVIKSYGAWGEKKFMGKTYQGTKRNTYLIDTKGVIKKEYLNVNPIFHSTQILKDIEELI